MIAEATLKQLQEIITASSKEELLWINGYLNGIVANASGNTNTEIKSAGTKKITIAYGTETGNSKKLATDFAAKAKKKGIQTKLVSLDQYRLNDLSKEEYFFTVISTHGEGEPPAAAQKFYDHIHNNGFKVPQLKYGVLALGDTSYPLFCKTGEDVDVQLQQLGASRIAPLQKCDLDYDEPAEEWFERVLKTLDNTSVATTVSATPVITKEKAAGKKIYSGTVLSNINLTARGSSKKTYHIELEAEGVEYLPGDSIAVIPENDDLAVKEILALTKADAGKIITWKKETGTIEELLTKKINISYLLEKIVKQYAVTAEKEIPGGRADLVELLRKYPLRSTAQFEELLQNLNPIAPRIYNIASSPAVHGNEIHIIALQDVFEKENEKKLGLCTVYFETKKERDCINFFIQPNKRFRLPAGDKDIIMIGPGTGIAPFRSFITGRDAVGATGRNWLFFAEEQFTTDFYYQTEWQNFFNTGVLTKINLAFSKDNEEEILVQHKLLQQASELFDWIKSGAYIYLCGQKEPMSKEVEEMLQLIFQQQGNLSKDQAKKYFEQLKEEGRYMKDVY
jgi:sulfite reductase (NADPH) flavoprotein alpha-component